MAMVWRHDDCGRHGATASHLTQIENNLHGARSIAARIYIIDPVLNLRNVRPTHGPLRTARLRTDSVKRRELNRAT